MNCEENLDIIQGAAEAISSLLPLKSNKKYENCFAIFNQWRKNKDSKGIDEIVLLAYFYEKVGC